MKPVNVAQIKAGNLAVYVGPSSKVGDLFWITEDGVANLEARVNWFLHYDIFDFRGCNPDDYELYLITLPINEYDDYEEYMTIIMPKGELIVSDDGEHVVFTMDYEGYAISHIIKETKFIVKYSDVTKLIIPPQNEETV